MHHELTAIIERDEAWFIASSPEIPGANGQGRTSDEARALRAIPESAIRETVKVE
jgi:predicted RNase H-like HicB family nuclease